MVTGTADITAGGLYGGGGTLNGESLILNVNGGGALTLVLNGTTNTLNEAAFLAAITSEWASLTGTQAGPGANKLVLTAAGATTSIVVGAGTANAHLGLTAGTTLSASSFSTLTLTLAFDAAASHLVTFGTIAANADITTAINAVFGAVSSFNSSNELVLTSRTAGYDSYVNIVSR